MKHWRILALLLTFTGATFAATAHADHDDVYKLRQTGDILPLEDILKQARDRASGTLLEAELEQEHGRYVYEVEMLSDEGRHREFYFDAKTGELIKEE